MSRVLTLSTLAAVALIAAAPDARAASYGNFTDPTGTVSYLNVRDVNGLFGNPSVSLDSIDFTPAHFQALCSSCPGGVKSVSDTLSLDIQSIEGKKITQLEITEGLNFTLESRDPIGQAAVDVVASVFVSVLELNGVAVSGIGVEVPLSLSPTLPSVVGDGFQTGVILGGTGSIDIAQIIQNAGATGDATRLSIGFGNTLRAFHDGSLGFALIRKRDADFVSITVEGGLINTPEPSTAILLIGGLALLAGRRSKT